MRGRSTFAKSELWPAQHASSAEQSSQGRQRSREAALVAGGGGGTKFPFKQYASNPPTTTERTST